MAFEDIINDYIAGTNYIREPYLDYAATMLSDIYRTRFQNRYGGMYGIGQPGGYQDVESAYKDFLSGGGQSAIQRALSQSSSGSFLGTVRSSPLPPSFASGLDRLTTSEFGQAAFQNEDPRYKAGLVRLQNARTIGDVENIMVDALRPQIGSFVATQSKRRENADPDFIGNALSSTWTGVKQAIPRLGGGMRFSMPFLTQSGILGGLKSDQRAITPTGPTASLDTLVDDMGELRVPVGAVQYPQPTWEQEATTMRGLASTGMPLTPTGIYVGRRGSRGQFIPAGQVNLTGQQMSSLTTPTLGPLNPEDVQQYQASLRDVLRPGVNIGGMTPAYNPQSMYAVRSGKGFRILPYQREDLATGQIQSPLTEAFVSQANAAVRQWSSAGTSRGFGQDVLMEPGEAAGTAMMSGQVPTQTYVRTNLLRSVPEGAINKKGFNLSDYRYSFSREEAEMALEGKTPRKFYKMVENQGQRAILPATREDIRDEASLALNRLDAPWGDPGVTMNRPVDYVGRGRTTGSFSAKVGAPDPVLRGTPASYTPPANAINSELLFADRGMHRIRPEIRRTGAGEVEYAGDSLTQEATYAEERAMAAEETAAAQSALSKRSLEVNPRQAMIGERIASTGSTKGYTSISPLAGEEKVRFAQARSAADRAYLDYLEEVDPQGERTSSLRSSLEAKYNKYIAPSSAPEGPPMNDAMLAELEARYGGAAPPGGGPPAPPAPPGSPPDDDMPPHRRRALAARQFIEENYPEYAKDWMGGDKGKYHAWQAYLKENPRLARAHDALRADRFGGTMSDQLTWNEMGERYDPTNVLDTWKGELGIPFNVPRKRTQVDPPAAQARQTGVTGATRSIGQRQTAFYAKQQAAVDAGNPNAAYLAGFDPSTQSIRTRPGYRTIEPMEQAEKYIREDLGITDPDQFTYEMQRRSGLLLKHEATHGAWGFLSKNAQQAWSGTEGPARAQPGFSQMSPEEISSENFAMVGAMWNAPGGKYRDFVRQNYPQAATWFEHYGNDPAFSKSFKVGNFGSKNFYGMATAGPPVNPPRGRAAAARRDFSGYSDVIQSKHTLGGIDDPELGELVGLNDQNQPMLALNAEKFYFGSMNDPANPKLNWSQIQQARGYAQSAFSYATSSEGLEGLDDISTLQTIQARASGFLSASIENLQAAKDNPALFGRIKTLSKHLLGRAIQGVAGAVTGDNARMRQTMGQMWEQNNRTIRVTNPEDLRRQMGENPELSSYIMERGGIERVMGSPEVAFNLGADKGTIRFGQTGWSGAMGGGGYSGGSKTFEEIENSKQLGLARTIAPTQYKEVERMWAEIGKNVKDIAKSSSDTAKFSEQTYKLLGEDTTAEGRMKLLKQQTGRSEAYLEEHGAGKKRLGGMSSEEFSDVLGRENMAADIEYQRRSMLTNLGISKSRMEAAVGRKGNIFSEQDFSQQEFEAAAKQITPGVGRGRSLFSNPISQGAYGLWIARSTMGMFTEPVMQNMQAYGQYASQFAGLGPGAVASTEAGWNIRKEQADRFWQRGAMQQFGGMTDASLIMQSMPGMEAVSRAKAGLSWSVGLAAGGFFGAQSIGAMSGGLLTPGAAAAGSTLAAGAGIAGLALGTGTIGMEINNAFRPDDKWSWGRFMTDRARELTLQQAGMAQNPFRQIGENLQASFDWKNILVGTNKWWSPARLFTQGQNTEDPTAWVDQSRLSPQQKMALKASGDYTGRMAGMDFAEDVRGLTGEDTGALANMYRTLGRYGINERQLYNIASTGWDSGRFGLSDTVNTAGQIAQAQGMPMGRGFAGLLDQVAGMNAQQRDEFLNQAQTTARWGSSLAQYYTDPRQANAFTSRNNIRTAAQAQPLMSAAQAAAGYGINMSDIMGYNVSQVGGVADRAGAAITYGDFFNQATQTFGGAQVQRAAGFAGTLQGLGYQDFTSAMTLGLSLNQRQMGTVAGGIQGAQAAGFATTDVGMNALASVYRGFTQQAFGNWSPVQSALYQAGGTFGSVETLARQYGQMAPERQAPYSQFFGSMISPLSMAGLSGDQIAGVGAQFGLMSTQDQMLSAMSMQGDLGARSWRAHQEGDVANMYMDLQGRPIYQSSGTQFRHFLSSNMDRVMPYLSAGRQQAMEAIRPLSGEGTSAWAQRALGLPENYAEAFASGGVMGIQAESMKRQAGIAGAGAALQLQSLNLRREFMWGYGQGGTWDNPSQGSMWWYEDVMRSRGYQQQQQQFASQAQRMSLGQYYAVQSEGMQQQRMELGQQQQMWNFGFQAQGMALQRSWTREDWQFQDQMSQLQFGWQIEDVNEAIRTSSGRQRRQLVRQRERMTETQSLTEEQTEKQRERQEEVWAREDERFQKQVEYATQIMELDQQEFDLRVEQREVFAKLDREDFERQKKSYEENFQLQEEITAKQREHQAAQMEIQEKQIGLSAAAAAEQAKIAEAMQKISEAYEDVRKTQENIDKYDIESKLDELDRMGAGISKLDADKMLAAAEAQEKAASVDYNSIEASTDALTDMLKTLGGLDLTKLRQLVNLLRMVD